MLAGRVPHRKHEDRSVGLCKGVQAVQELNEIVQEFDWVGLNGWHVRARTRGCCRGWDESVDYGKRTWTPAPPSTWKLNQRLRPMEPAPWT